MNSEGSVMLKVSSAEFHKHLGHYQDLALNQAVAITRNGRDRQVLTLDDFTDADVAAMEATRASEASKAFDDELTQ